MFYQLQMVPGALPKTPSQPKALPQRQKGRGAPVNQLSSRFNLPAKEIDSDWLDSQALIDGGRPPLRTEVTIEHSRSILSRNTSPDIPFAISVNPYRGCEHGCIYCYARPSHAWVDLSPGLDFESRLFAKPDAALLLRESFAKPGYKPDVLAIGTNTDPYQPIEDRFRITRSILALCLETRHPISITTKSNRLLRDLDLLKQLASHNLIQVAISVTSLDPALARSLEPRAPSPQKRLMAVRQLADHSIPVQANMSPVIPAINDHEIEAVVAAAADAGASHVSHILVRLPHEVAPLFRAWLDTHFPERADKVMNIIREMRGGRDNDPQFGSRMKGQGPWASLMHTRFKLALRKVGLAHATWAPDLAKFRRPNIHGQGELDL